MASTFVPVETILKVDDDDELVIGESQKENPRSSSLSTFVSIGTQCDWKIDHSLSKPHEVFHVSDANAVKNNRQENLTIGSTTADDQSLIQRNWPTHHDAGNCNDQKVLIPSSYPQLNCNLQTFPVDDKFFLQFDYKTRNKLKTKQRRLDPFYRTQERVRQRTVMRIKRQDPRFRAMEREKGRYRMRMKRLDPIFRSQERERQRERMKIKRSDPDFREREREKQKTRLHVKRLDPAYKEKERAQDRLRMRVKRQNGLYTTTQLEKEKLNSRIEMECATPDSESSVKSNTESCTTQSEIQSNVPIFTENMNARFLSLKPKESNLETLFHFKKAHIFNFNFYNSTKEHWGMSSEICIKDAINVNVDDDIRKLQSTQVVQSHAILLEKEHFLVPKKSSIPAFKSNLFPQTLANAISESSTSHIDMERKATKNSGPVHQLALGSAPEN